MSADSPTAMTPEMVARVHELFASDEIAAAMGVTLVAVGGDSVTLEMTVRDDHVGWHGRCHGGVLFTLADIAMSYLGNRFPGQAYAIHAAIDFVAPVNTHDVVRAEARESARRDRAAVIDVALRVGEETVGAFRGNALGSRPANT